MLVFVQLVLTVMASRFRRPSWGSAVCMEHSSELLLGLRNSTMHLAPSGKVVPRGSLHVNGVKPARGAGVRYRSCVYTPPCWHSPQGGKKTGLMDKKTSMQNKRENSICFSSGFSPELSVCPCLCQREN